FFRNVRNHVVKDVEAEHTTVAASTGDGLQGGHHHSVDTKSTHKRGQGDHQTYGGAVGIRRNKTLPSTLLALALDEPGMVIVDARYQDGHVVLVAKCRGRAQHRAAFGILRFQYFGSIRLDTSKNDVEA